MRWYKIAAFIVAGLFVVLLIYSGWNNRSAIMPFLIEADYSHLSTLFIIYIISYTSSMAGWVAIIHTFTQQLDWWSNAQIYSLTQATRRIPGTIWYVGSRVAIYSQLGLNKTTIILANAIELLVLLVTAGILGTIFLLITRTSITIYPILTLIISMTIAITILQPSVLRWLLRKIGSPPSTNLTFRRILLWASIYIVVWISSGLMLNQLVNVFNYGTTDQALFVIGAWALSNTAGILTFFLPTTFGATELAITILLSPILPLPLAGTVAIIMRFLTTILEIGFSVIFYFIARKSPHLSAVLNASKMENQQK
jgi:hypothetical protein